MSDNTINTSNLVENFKKLFSNSGQNTKETTGDFSLFGEENAKLTLNGTEEERSEKYDAKDGVFDSQGIFEGLNTDGNETLSLEEFQQYFDINNSSESQIEELYNLMSSLDGENELTQDELDFVMNLQDDPDSEQDNDFSLKDIQNFISQAKAQFESADAQKEVEHETVTIEKGSTPIGLMKQIEGAGEFSADDYNTLMAMNIEAGNIEDTTMSDTLQAKYGVKYMLHPDMKITMYTQDEINAYKEQHPELQSSGGSDAASGTGDDIPASDTPAADNTKGAGEGSRASSEKINSNTKIYKDENGNLTKFAYYATDYTLSYDGKNLTIKTIDENGEETTAATIAHSANGNFQVVENKNSFPESSDIANNIKNDSEIVQFGNFYMMDGKIYDKSGKNVSIDQYTGHGQEATTTKKTNKASTAQTSSAAGTKTYGDTKVTTNAKGEITSFTSKGGDVKFDGKTFTYTAHYRSGLESYHAIYTLSEGENASIVQQDEVPSSIAKAAKNSNSPIIKIGDIYYLDGKVYTENGGTCQFLKNEGFTREDI